MTLGGASVFATVGDGWNSSFRESSPPVEVVRRVAGDLSAAVGSVCLFEADVMGADVGVDDAAPE